MAKKWKKVAALAVATVMSATTLSGLLTACKPGDESDNTDGVVKKGTYRTFTSTMPSNWNELTYKDNNDTQILDYLGSSFFTYDYDFGGNKFKADGTVNADAIVDGGYTIQYEAATKLEDVTASVDSKWGYTAEQKAEGGYAYKITLRDDLKWDDGTPIDASDFVYSMQEQLNPKFLNFRANQYYDSIQIKGAYNYYYQGSALYDSVISENTEGDYVGYVESGVEKGSDGFYTLPNSVPHAEKDAHVYTSVSKDNMFFGASLTFVYNYSASYRNMFYGLYDGEVTDPEDLPDYVFAVQVPVENGGEEGGETGGETGGEEGGETGGEEGGETGGVDAQAEEGEEGGEEEEVEYETVYYFNYYEFLKDKEDEFGYLMIDDAVMDALMVISANAGDGSELSWQEFCFYVSGYGADADWDTVGLYSPSKYELVVCMDTPISMLDDKGGLTYNAAYYMSSLPLVKKDLYEKCKVAPVTGSKLWTSKYNSSLDTTASWGPYKLTDFQAGKGYTLEKNDNWFAYSLDDYKNQYNIEKIECERIADNSTQWTKFFAGEIDGKGIDTAHLADYKNSKYAVFSPGSATFGLQIYSGLDAIKANGRNNGILAIPEFRQAMSLALDRGQFATDVLAPNQPAYGVLNKQYYYDVENGGVYRNSTQAKEGLLRAYGYTQASDGTWSNASGTITGYTTDDAYDTIGGSNMTKAKQLVEAAIAKLTADKEAYGYNPDKHIEILIGWSSPNPTYTNAYNYFKAAWEKMVEGTALEGQIDVTFDENRGSKWSDDFKKGIYDISPLSGISGNALNPYSVIRSYVDPGYGLNYHTYWNTNSVELTITFGEDANPDYSGKTFTMSALNWYACLNNVAGTWAGQNGYESVTNTSAMGAGFLSESNRLLILAALEELVLEQYYFVPLVSDYSASLLGAKFSYLTDEYNMFMGFGGMRYMTVNYTDKEWVDFVASFGTQKLENFYKLSD